MEYIYAQFEVVLSGKKLLGYGQFEPYQYHSFSFYKINNGKSDKNVITTKYIKLLAFKSDIKFDEINLITILDNQIDTKFLSHFPIILNQKSNPELKIEVDNSKFILFDDLDYESDESEHPCSLIKYKQEDEFIFVTECIKDMWDLPNDPKLSIRILIEAIDKIKNELDDFSSVEFWDGTTEEEKEDYKNSLTKCIPWLTDKIKELESIPCKYDESFVKSKKTSSDNKIKFYKYLIRNKLLDKKTCSIKIANQILRKQKLDNPEKIKYNFVITNFSYSKDRNGMKHYKIEFCNESKDVEGVFTFDKKGYFTCSGYESKMKIKFKSETDLDKEYFKDIFQGDLFYELFGHNSGDDGYDNCECDE